MKSIQLTDNSWTLFLDRDGVINTRNFEGYITKPEDFIFTNQFLESVEELAAIFSKIIVVTNQQGVGKKIMNERNLSDVHTYMVDCIEKVGGRIDFINFASELRSDEMNRMKPKPIMALEAKEKFEEIDFSKSIMVGDTDSDLEFGMNLGMTTVAISSKEVLTVKPDFEVADFKEFLKIISYEF